ncbi:tRNA lysidine(34) synthetase TilS [Hydrogenobacter thermophilus]|uniref:tRNA lysidine(34) synthetase TilS n=1 Tax=Hydrogenobacter thermophilus TaxID=940 RepID=UPI0030FC7FAB
MKKLVTRSTLLRKVITLQRQKKLIPEEASVLIAFSGGIDSVALTLAMLELKDFFRLKRLALAHINHGIRENSENDEEFALEFAKRKGLEVFVEKFKVKEMAKDSGENLEALAREVRYRALRDIKNRKGFDLIATAHHLNDLVETIILWLVRGSGLDGLTGFDEKLDDIVRPLYWVTKEEIREFVISRKELWVEDITNYDVKYARNRIRHRVLPELKKINPDLEASVLRLRNILKEEEDFIKEQSLKALERCTKGQALRRRVLKSLHPALQRRVLSLWLGVKDMRKIEQAMHLIIRGGSMDLGEGIRLKVEGDYLYLQR